MSELIRAYDTVTQSLSHKTKLICVSKTKPAHLISELYQHGHLAFGENKVAELLEKSKELTSLDKIEWHFIGHLQSNKINQLLSVKNLVSIHSIDRMNLLEKLLSKTIDKRLGLFLQINTSEEVEKSGFTNLKELPKAMELIKAHPHFYFQGFMTIGKIRTNDFEKEARTSFQKLKDLQLVYPQAELSMGMSSDYLIAQEYDSDWLRVGSSIFGIRHH